LRTGPVSTGGGALRVGAAGTAVGAGSGESLGDAMADVGTGGAVVAGAADGVEAATGADAAGDSLGIGAVAAGAHAVRRITSTARRFTWISTWTAAHWFSR